MSVSPLMSLGTRAMAASYASLQATGNNISNANTAGYSRQTAELQTAGGMYTGAGFFGQGVNVATVTRSHNEFLTREASNTRSVAAADEARSTQLARLEAVFKTGEAGIGYAAGTLFNAFADVASKPQDASSRQVVLGAADDLAARFRNAGNQLDSLQAGVSLDLRTAVTTVNSLTQQIANLNQKIANLKGAGHSPNDLLDQRDTAINELSQYVQVSTIGADDGSTSVFLQGGQSLVLGTQVTNLGTVRDPYDPSKFQVGLQQSGVTRALPDGYLTGGSLAGMVRFQNKDLIDARNLLGQTAAAISGSLNKQQSLGLDLGQPPTTGAAILSVGLPMVSAASTNAAVGGIPVASTIDGTGARVPSVGLTVTDSSQLLASDYQLRADPSGTPGLWQLTRMSDGVSRSVASGAVVDGFRVDVANPQPAAGDSFLLQPVGSAARNMQRVLDDPKGLAAAAPVTGTTAVTNTGTATIASLAASSTALNANLTATITFTDANGGYSVSLVDSTGALPTTTTTGTWTAGQPITLNGWTLQLNGVPRQNDVVSVQKTEFPGGDNGNARALLALRDAAIVGQINQADGSIVPGNTVTDAYADTIANIGVRVQSAQTAADQSASMAAEAQTAVSSDSGVNLDEEAARLLQFQQSYQAAAKMLQVAQSIFDSLLQVAGR